MFFAKPRLVGALKHNQSYQDASPSIYFFLIATVLQSLLRALCLTVFTRLRLVSDGRRQTMIVLRRGVFGDTQVKPFVGLGSQFDRD